MKDDIKCIVAIILLVVGFIALISEPTPCGWADSFVGILIEKVISFAIIGLGVLLIKNK